MPNRKPWWGKPREELGGISAEDWLRREYSNDYDFELATKLSDLLARNVTKNAVNCKAKSMGLFKSSEFFEAHYESLRPPHMRVVRFTDYHKISGGATVAGDFHIPLHDLSLVEKMVSVSMKMNSKQLIIAGDFFNFDAFSWYITEKTYFPGEEIDYGEKLLDWMVQWYDLILVLMGNHEKRLYRRKLDKEIDWERVTRMFTKHEDKIIFSKYGYCVLDDVWRITHPKNYRQIPTRVANELAFRHRQNILNFHGHTLSITHDKSGRYLIADGGGMFDESKIEYRMIEDSTYPAWYRGFWVIDERNQLHAFNDLWTPWEFYERVWELEE